MHCVIWTNPGNCLRNMDQCYKWQYLYKVLEKCFIGYQLFVQTINKQSNLKQIWQRFQAPFGQSEFVQMLTKFFASVNDDVFSWFVGIDAAGKVAESETCMKMSITEILKTFIVSFQICDRLFVIITMTSLGSRKRPFPHGVRCEVCQKQLSSDNRKVI